MTARTRLDPDERKRIIVDAAAKVARESPHGEFAVTYAATAEACAAPTTWHTVKHYFPTVGELRKAAAPGS